MVDRKWNKENHIFHSWENKEEIELEDLHLPPSSVGSYHRWKKIHKSEVIIWRKKVKEE